jgi:phage gp36-like protein
MTAAYATQDDIVALYGADALFVADRDGDGVAEAPAVARALASASEEINSFLAVRYPLPLTSTPGVLVQKTKDVQSVEHRQRYEDALAWLKALGKGEVSLMLPANGDLEGESPSQPEAPAPIVVAGPERLFSRAAMRGVP